MVRASEIRNRGSLAEWLEARPPLDGVMISQRTVCRILPLYGAAMARPWAREGNLTALTLLRLNLSSAALWHVDTHEQASFPVPDSQSIKLACNAARTDSDLRVQHIPDATLGAADVAFDARDGFAPSDNVERVVAVAVRAVEDEQFLWLQVEEDVRSLEEGRNLSSMPLWSVAEPEWFRKADAEMRAIWAEDNPKHWDFWLRWWKGVLSGRQLPWKLQAQAGQIAKENLDAGVAAVAEEIAKIEERLYLLDLIAELKRSHAEATAAAAINVASPLQRGHNQPPELIDPSIKVRETTIAISAALDEAETELVKLDPAPSALRRIATTLAATVAMAASYCGDKLDIFITKAVEEGGSAFGKWGVLTLIACWATPNGTMQMLIKGLFDLASKLSP